MDTLFEQFPADNAGRVPKELIQQRAALLGALHVNNTTVNYSFNKNELLQNNDRLKRQLQYLTALLEQLT